MLRFRSVRARLFGSFLSLVVCFAIVAVMTALSVRTVQEHYLNAIGQQAAAVKLARSLERDAAEAMRAIYQFANLQESGAMMAFNATVQSYMANLEALNNLLADNPEGLTMVKEIGSAMTALDEQSRLAFAMSNPTREEIQSMTQRLSAPRAQLTDAIRNLVILTEANQATATSAAAAKADLVPLVLGGGGLVVVVISLAVAWFISNSIAGATRAAGALAARVADGDLRPAGQTRRGGGGELDAMAAALDAMVDGLRTVVAGVQQSARTLGETARGLGDAARQSAASAAEVAQSMGDVAQGTNQQSEAAHTAQTNVRDLERAIANIADGMAEAARQVQDTSARLENVLAAAAESASAAHRMATGAEAAVGAAQDASAVIGRAVGSIHRIENEVSPVVAAVGRLEQHSARIGEITGTIAGVADQTNLLALNAQIEAARAGDAGRGFAVVADEIRKLADTATMATEQINQTITGIQAEISGVARAMTSSRAAVAEGRQLAEGAGTALTRILSHIEHSNEEVKAIATAAHQVELEARTAAGAVQNLAALMEESSAATEEMSAASVEVGQAAEAVAQVAQQNAAAAQEVSAATEELSAGTALVNGVAADLTQVAAELQGLASRFRL